MYVTRGLHWKKFANLRNNQTNRFFYIHSILFSSEKIAKSWDRISALGLNYNWWITSSNLNFVLKQFFCLIWNSNFTYSYENISSVPGIVIWSLWHILVNLLLYTVFFWWCSCSEKKLLTLKVAKNDLNLFEPVWNFTQSLVNTVRSHSNNTWHSGGTCQCHQMPKRDGGVSQIAKWR